MKALYICAFDPKINTNSYYQDWMLEFEKSGFDIFNSYNDNLSKLLNLINPYYYDIIVFGFSSLTHLHGRSKQLISKLIKLSRATVVGFLQNEFRNLSTIVEQYRFLNVKVLVSQFSPDLAKEIYSGRTKAKILSLPHAMSPINDKIEFKHRFRKIDLCGRLRTYAYYLGNYPRQTIIPKFIRKVKKEAKLSVDFSSNEEDRLKYTEWRNFLKTSRAAISCESGNFFLQWSDSLRKKINNLIIKDKRITFAEIFKNILKKSNTHFHGGLISSRHFDAISNGSCNLLVEGKYQGLIEADKHYIELKSDFSNYNEIIEKLSDYKYTEKVAKAALNHTLQYHTIKKRINHLLDSI